MNPNPGRGKAPVVRRSNQAKARIENPILVTLDDGRTGQLIRNDVYVEGERVEGAKWRMTWG